MWGQQSATPLQVRLWTYREVRAVLDAGLLVCCYSPRGTEPLQVRDVRALGYGQPPKFFVEALYPGGRWTWCRPRLVWAQEGDVFYDYYPHS